MKLLLYLIPLLLMPAAVFAQGTKADFERSQNLYKNSRSLITGNKVKVQWNEEKKQAWYKVNDKSGETLFYLVDLQTGKKVKAFDNKRLTEDLKKLTSQKFNPINLPVSHIESDENFSKVIFTIKGQSFSLDKETYSLKKHQLSSVTPELLEQRENSSGGGTLVSLEIENLSSDTLKIFWVDFKGKNKSFGDIKAGESSSISSYGKHVWEICNANGELIKTLKLKNKPNKISISAQKARTRTKKSPWNVSPDGKWKALIKNHNLFLINRESGMETQISTSGDKKDFFTNSFKWSPDSKYIVCMKERGVTRRKISIVESSPKEQLQPRLITKTYTKPGDPLPYRRPKLFNLETLKEIPLSENLYQNPFNIKRVRWKSDSKSFTFVFNERGHQTLRVLSADAKTGKIRAVIDERSKTFVHYSGKFFLHHLDSSNEMIWISERDGWNHLYLIDSANGKVKNQITVGNWPVKKVIRVDEKNRQIYFEATGIYSDQDPYHVHLCRVNFDGTGFTKLTDGDGTHTYEFSPEGNYLFATCSRVDLPPVTEIRRTMDGKKICELERANWDQLTGSGWKPTIRFNAKGRDGQTDIWGIIVLPSNFDPSKKYPVIEQIYAGPHDSHVPKSWNPLIRRHQLAEMGFIVVSIDGMGTSNRSKAFHDVCWKNLGDAGFPDRILWMKTAAKKIPQMDLSRVGIYGGSAGGQNAMRALIAHGDFYKAAAADCGCHDNRMDKIWWNEQWMGWPIGKHYEEQSNVTQAHKITGKLLLTVGELDTNVDPASTMQVVDALIKADKDFELIVFPGKGHGIGWSKYGMKRIYKFFIRSFYGKEADF